MENNPTRMKLITPSDVSAASFQSYNTNKSIDSSEQHVYRDGFKAGVSFAESELMEVMREAIEWAGKYYVECHGGWMKRFESQIKAPVYTTDQLITKFLEERK